MMTTSSLLVTRFRPLMWLGACFFIIAFITRLILLLMTGSGVPASPFDWLYIFAVGLGYDLITFIYVAWPMVLWLWLVPTRRGRLAGWKHGALYALTVAVLCALCLVALRLTFDVNWKTAWPAVVPFLFVLPLATFTYTSRAGQRLLYIFCLLFLFGLLFVGAAELTFWNEFSTRFNFIAVDYLIYTREVLGNIGESYPIVRWLLLLTGFAVIGLMVTRRYLRTDDDNSRFGKRSLVVLVWLVLTVVSAMMVNAQGRNHVRHVRNVYVQSLAGNGIYQFFAAFRDAGLNFNRFYRNLPDRQAYLVVRKLLKTPYATFVSSDPHDITRIIRHHGPEKHLNVVLVSVESLSAKYLTAFGQLRHLTPNLDKLARQSLFFQNMYANGTRTVRGLEALALSIPPTPGDSLVKQKHNEGLFSLAAVFNQRGYVSAFVYGGYGYFDNMNYFFAHNGYRIVDRRAIPVDMTIHSETVGGVADEDLFPLPMRQMDATHRQGKSFFLHIMTTSNHRPYLWPKGRVDLPQGHRDGAVKYTDWAIGDFIRRMRTRPYFSDTVFIITADHCASSAGRTRIPLNKYHIPLIIYAPAHIQARQVGLRISQMDVAPTLLGLLHFSYRSRFFGHDIFAVRSGQAWAFPSTYQNLGYLRGDRLTILSPERRVVQVRPDARTGDVTPYTRLDPVTVNQAIAMYQVAYDEFNSGRMRWRTRDATPVPSLTGHGSRSDTDQGSSPIRLDSGKR